MPARQQHSPNLCSIAATTRLAAAVSKQVGLARYGLWFQGHARFVPLGREVTIAVRNEQSRDWLEHTFGTAVREAVVEVCGPNTAVRWGIDSEIVQETGVRSHESADGRRESEKTSPRREAEASAPARSQKDLFGDPLSEPRRKKRPEAEAGERLERYGPRGASDRSPRSSSARVIASRTPRR